MALEGRKGTSPAVPSHTARKLRTGFPTIGHVSGSPPSGGARPGSLLAAVRVDFAPQHRQPRIGPRLIAFVIALGGSLGADAILVAIGTRVFPTTRDYVHFHFSDYGKLTVIGVVVACAGWPIVTRISSAPRWLFLRAAILITLVLWLPDLYILVRGQSAEAVAVLMVMHLAIAVETYNALLHVAPIRSKPKTSSPVIS
jgi:hypothetical protein